MKKLNFLLIIVFISFYLMPFHCFSQNWQWAINDGNRDQGDDPFSTVTVEGNKMAMDDIGFLYVAGAQSAKCNLCKIDSNGNTKWTSVISGQVGAGDICIDPYANIYITGGFAGTIYFGSTPLTTDVYDDMFIAKYDSSGNFQWAKKAGQTSHNDYGYCIIADSNNVFVSGNLSAGIGYFETTLFVGYSYLAKYNSNGIFQWVNNLAGSTDGPRSYSMKIDILHNIYITGTGGGTFTFGSNTLVTNGNNIFIAKYNSSGICTLAITTSGTGPNKSSDMDLDNSGNMYITGSFSGTCSFGNGNSVVSSGYMDAFLAKYNSAGICQWVIKAGGTSQDIGCGLSVKGNYVYFTGQFVGSVIFPGTSVPLTTFGYQDIFIAKYTTTTHLPIFVESAGGASVDLGRVIKIFNDTNVYVTGAYTTSATFGTITLNGGYSSFVAKYKPCISPIFLSQSNSLACCVGDLISLSVNVSGSTPLNYQWKKNGTNITGANNSILSISSVSISDGATYTCSVNNGCGTILCSPIVLTVNPLPATAGTISGSTAICQGQSNITYTVPTITNATSYIWTVPSGATGSSITNSINVNYGTSAVSGNITVKGNNSCGDGTLSSLAVTVDTLPSIAGIISGTTPVCQGQNSVTYTVPTIVNATTYSWSLPSGATGTSTTNSIIISFNNTAVSGNITVNGHNNCGDGITSNLYITVVPKPNANAGNDTIICPGSSIILTATGGNSYIWNNSVTQGVSFSPVSTNTYTVTVSNGFCTSTDNVIVTIATPPPAPVIYQIGNVLNSTASSGNQWYNDSGIIIGATGQTFTPSLTSHYFVFVTDINGCISDTSNVLYIVVDGISNSFFNKDFFNIYPNPITNELIIEFKGNNDKLNFEIINSIGQTVFNGILIEKTIVKTTDFAHGIYMIKINNGKTFEFKKIVKE